MAQPVQPLSCAMNDLGFSSWQEQIFSSPRCLDWLWSQTASYSMGRESPFLGLKRLGHEADHSPQTTAKVKNGGSYTSTSPVCLRGIMYRDNLTFIYTVLIPAHLEDSGC